MIQNGKTLSMHNDAVFKGGVSHNGTLLKMHENSYTIGYSALLSPNGASAGTAKFGDGVFLDLAQKNNRAYVGKPTVVGAVPAFGGIIVREPAIASGYPVNNDEVQGFQHGLLCREGFLVYKKGKVVYSATDSVEDIELFDCVYQNYCLWISASDGSAYFTPKSTVYAASDDIMVGRVVEINPDDRSVTVYVTPAILADTATVSGSTPTITVNSTTKDSATAALTVGVNGTFKVAYKKTADSSFTDVEGVIVPAYNEETSKWETEFTFDGLTASTAYTFKVIAFTVNGMASATGTATTASA